MTAPTSTQTVTVKLSASLRAAAGIKEMHIPWTPQMNVRDLLLALGARSPVLAERLLDHDQALSKGLQVLVNGRHIDFLSGLDTPINATDSVLLIPPVGGG